VTYEPIHPYTIGQVEDLEADKVCDRDMPEQPITPPEDKYITAGCGHDVSEGELLIDWTGKKVTSICLECLNDKWDELSPWEKADLFGCEYRTVTFQGG
jgi:hypothetical protein